MIYGLAGSDLVSRWFCRLHPKYGTPTRCIWASVALVLFAPFLGKLFFLPLINTASLATIIMWVTTLFAVLRLRRTHPELRRPVSMPGGRVTAVLGIIASLFLTLNLVLPFSPGGMGALDYLLAGVLAVVGLLLYHGRDRTITDADRSRRMFGDLL